MAICSLNKLLLHPATGIGVDVVASSAENLGMALMGRTWQGQLRVTLTWLKSCWLTRRVHLT